jgi:hypothetical protein
MNDSELNYLHQQMMYESSLAEDHHYQDSIDDDSMHMVNKIKAKMNGRD